ncbi:MAG: hypothetical protein HZA53_11165 [Planctomycetes bacterium]|nr:hypothetical protein [Planctomycetota bacterium]
MRALVVLPLLVAVGCSSPKGHEPARGPAPAKGSMPNAVVAAKLKGLGYLSDDKPQGAVVDRKPVAGAVAEMVAAEKPASLAFGDSATPRELPPIFAGTTYDPKVPTPDSALRQPLGTFTAHHAEILAYLKTLERASPRLRWTKTGVTHEGRELGYAVIASPENMAKLDALRANVAKLADPRTTNDEEAERIAKDTPAIAWLSYSIHGDEMSGCDASMAVAHHLVAGTSADVNELLSNVVVVIDPSQNPDGRERILSMLEQSAGYVPNLDGDSMSRGRWPHGRGNHYLFDMNRDWIWGTQPETRARWGAIQSFHPQLLVDAHEMGSNDTFLFYPATDPLTPWFPQHTVKWWKRFGGDEAAAFDRHGWSYYTREWADSWYPGYTDSWATFTGAVGILYEQARYHGQAVRRPSGEIATYRDAVARQATGSIANVTTLAKNKVEILRDYYAAKKANVAAETPGNDRTFVLARGKRPEREAEFVRMLAGQGIEVFEAEAEFTAKDVETTLAGKLDERKFPAGSLIVPARQPLAPMVKAFLAFDPRYDVKSLERERKELERKGRSKAYDVTGWSPAHAFDLDAAWCGALDVAKKRVTELPPSEAGIAPLDAPSTPVYGWLVDGKSDGAVVFAARAMELGLQVNVADEPLAGRGRPFARGSLLVRRVENKADVAELVQASALVAGVRAFAVGTAWSGDETPDLGGQHFTLLARPRVGLLTNSPISSSDFGATWHLVDHELGVPATLIDAQGLGGYDLRRYNVLVLPEGGIGDLLRDAGDELSTWVKSGGTLIASGSSAAQLCDASRKMTTTRLRSDALDKLDEYALAVKREREGGKTVIDPGLLWDGKASAKPAEEPKAPDDGKQGDGKQGDGKQGDGKQGDAKQGDAKKDGAKSAESKDDPAKEDKQRRDAWLATFSPQGVILRGEANPDAWLTYGCDDELPVYFSGSDVFLSQRPARTAVRLAASERLRLSGLLWPEARERIADSGYAVVERKGAGQIVLFASPPDFRNWFKGTMRLFANAIVYGPGAGANQPNPW